MLFFELSFDGEAIFAFAVMDSNQGILRVSFRLMAAVKQLYEKITHVGCVALFKKQY